MMKLHPNLNLSLKQMENEFDNVQMKKLSKNMRKNDHVALCIKLEWENVTFVDRT